MEEPPVVTLVGRVTVYTITGCLHCIRTKARLDELGLPYSEVDLRKHRHLRDKIRELTGRNTVPQIFFNNVHVGGNSDFQKMSREELDRLIELVKNQKLPPDAPPLPGENEEEDKIPDEELKCERDEYADIIGSFKLSGIIGNNRSGLKIHKRTFSGRQLVKWIIDNKSLDEGKAVDVGKALIYKKFINPLNGKPDFESSTALYRLIEHDKSSALNVGFGAECFSVPAAEHSEAMRELILNLFAEHISPDGKKVDYATMGESSTFHTYCQLAIQLQRVELDNLTRKEKLAFFINVYNALVIHGHIIYGSPKNVWQRYKFFNTVSYVIGGEIYTLQSIENGVLRANRKGVAQITKPFASSDPQLKVALTEVEPLIHFALNCGARSCPAIQTYNAKEVDTLLISAAEAFLEGDDGCSVDVSKREIRVSQIFNWYKVDFGGTDAKVVEWVYNHMSDCSKKQDLKKLLDSSHYKLSYLRYNWKSNAKE